MKHMRKILSVGKNTLSWWSQITLLMTDGGKQSYLGNQQTASHGEMHTQPMERQTDEAGQTLICCLFSLRSRSIRFNAENT